MKEHKIEDEQAYPIYSVEIRWTQDIRFDYEPADWQIKDLPKGRIHNSTTFSQMYKEEQDIETLKQKIETESVPKILAKKEHDLPIVNPSDVKIDVDFVRYETWCLEWFCHWTYDDGRSDEEYLQSFTNFVNRMERVEEYCLMGAEDRWRWKGTTDDGEGETPPPCRCAGCRKAGVVRVNH